MRERIGGGRATARTSTELCRQVAESETAAVENQKWWRRFRGIATGSDCYPSSSKIEYLASKLRGSAWDVSWDFFSKWLS